MPFAWIRRLFERRNTPAGVASEAATPTIAATTAECVPEPRVTVPEVPHETATITEIDWAARWTARLDEVQNALAAHPVASNQPDAAALLQLLREGPDTVIRQLPAAARQALALCDDAGLSRSQLGARLGNDPALVQALLRTANSAAFAAGRSEVLGIHQALDRIGVSGTRAVVLASCVDGLLSHPGGEFNSMASEVWAHMVRTAPIARAVAPAFAADSDEAFAIALLHDVGKLVIFDSVSILRASRRRPIVVDGSFAHYVLQQLHEPIGALAARRWGMGARASDAIGSHHRNSLSARRDSLSEVLFVAEHADHAMRRSVTLDLDALWQTGGLTGSPARVATALQSFSRAA